MPHRTASLRSCMSDPFSLGSARKKILLQTTCTRTSERSELPRRAAGARRSSGARFGLITESPVQVTCLGCTRRSSVAGQDVQLNCSEGAFGPSTAGSQHPPALLRWIRPYCPRHRISSMNLLEESIPPRSADARKTLTVEAFARENHMERLGFVRLLRIR